ncbi:HEAT repeat domain-containing protein [Rhodocista pekingensis]|uniref:HEAT repeat domain-containing protein n=1 Tax=Rhodocista pekingensis TaxID=201185 RepID=A0ABW2L1H0_9PROT
MPLVKGHSPTGAAAPSFPDRASVVAALAGSDPARRRAAARAAHTCADGVALIARALAVEEDPSVAEGMILALVEIGGEDAAAALAPLLRSEDATRRFAAAEALRDAGDEALSFFEALIRDDDPQVRIMAAEIARGPLGRTAAATLESLLPEEEEINVACAFIDVLSEIGTAATASVLRDFAARYPGKPYVRFTVDAALALLPAE